MTLELAPVEVGAQPFRWLLLFYQYDMGALRWYLHHSARVWVPTGSPQGVEPWTAKAGNPPYRVAVAVPGDGATYFAFATMLGIIGYGAKSWHDSTWREIERPRPRSEME